MTDILSERQQEVLKFIVQTFVLTANPVGSKILAKTTELGLSSASLRGVMADLEEAGYLSHPHVSAGRVPTDKGYRYYVNSLMGYENISKKDQKTIYTDLKSVTDADDLLKESSKILSRISHQLSFVTSPQLRSCILLKIEIISLSSSKLLIVLSVDSGLVKTITMEVTSEINQNKINNLNIILNERLTGLTLNQIRETFHNRLKDFEDEESGIIRLFVDNINKVFNEFYTRERLHISGTTNILSQPEFESPKQIRSIIELIDNEDIIIHLLDQYEEKSSREGLTILIGSEINVEKLHDYSLIISSYNIGENRGTIGVIGPKRMEYNKIIPIVNCVAEIISTNN